MILHRLLLLALSLAQLVVAQSSTNACPFAEGSAPFASLTGTVLQYAKNFQMQVTPYTIILQVGGKTSILSACNAPGTATPGSIVVPVTSVQVTANGVLGFIERLGQIATISAIPPQLCTSACSLTLGSHIVKNVTNAPAGTPVFGKSGFDVEALISSEVSPLAAFEWILFFDAFYGFQGKSQGTIQTVEASYSCMQQKVQAFKNSVGGSASAIPTVLVSQINATTNQVVSVANTNFWKVLFTDAGAYPQFATNLNSWNQIASASDAVFDVTPDTGISYDLTLWSRVYGVNSESKGYPFLNGFTSQVWRYDDRTASGYDDFLQSGFAQPEVILADIIAMLSSTYNPGFYHYYLRNLANTAGYYQVAASQCPASKSLSLPATPCAAANMFAPNIGRFWITTANSPVGSDGGGISGFIFNVAAFVGALVGILFLAVIGFLVYKKYGTHSFKKGAAGGSSWVSESAQKRKFFRMTEGTGGDEREVSGEGIQLGRISPMGRVGGVKRVGARAGSVASSQEGHVVWQNEHGMPMLPPDNN
ncbi:hypothetical protein HDU98_007234 [Podochytrium sp. JEL0797]|nr:hypothetical protein HDU98_007234 [Podochytrium sp. JEL0797]